MSRSRQLIPVIVGLVFLCLSIWGISHELRHYHPKDILDSLGNIPKSHKLGALALTILGYLCMTGYDGLGFLYIHQSLPLSKIIKTAFISYAVGNTVGFSLFSGTAIRYRLYGACGVSGVNIAKIVAFTHISFWLGMLAVGGIVFLVDPLTLPNILHLPFESVHAIGIIFLIIVGVYLAITLIRTKPFKIRGHELAIPSAKISLGLMIISAIDWALAAGVLYLLLPSHLGWSYPGFFGIYVLALTAGIMSNVPGGLGVFETVIIFLRPESVEASDILGSLLAYRGVYYFLPLIVALILLGIYELQQRYQKS